MDFDAKYTNLIERIDKIIYSDYNPKILQNYIKEYKIEKEIQVCRRYFPKAYWYWV